MNDNVKNPKHYQLFDGIESIEIIACSMTVQFEIIFKTYRHLCWDYKEGMFDE